MYTHLLGVMVFPFSSFGKITKVEKQWGAYVLVYTLYAILYEVKVHIFLHDLHMLNIKMLLAGFCSLVYCFFVSTMHRFDSWGVTTALNVQ